MKGKHLFGIVALMLMTLSAIGVYGQSVPLDLVEVQLEDVELFPSSFGVNRLDVERGQEVEVEIHLDAFDDVNDVEVEAFLSGYEYNDVESISDKTHVFDAEAGVTYIKKLRLKFPDLMDVDEYKLRIIISDRDNFEVIESFDLLIDTKRHDLKFSDIMLYPESDVKSGTALLARVRLENYGQKDESDVKVRVSIPELSLSAVDYINEIEEDEEEETEEMYLRIPCAKPGDYAVKIDVWSNEGHDSLTASRSITVSEGDMCKQLAAPTPATTQVVSAPAAPAEAPKADAKGNVRTALEVILLVLVALLVIVGLIIGFSRLKAEE